MRPMNFVPKQTAHIQSLEMSGTEQALSCPMLGQSSIVLTYTCQSSLRLTNVLTTDLGLCSTVGY